LLGEKRELIRQKGRGGKGRKLFSAPETYSNNLRRNFTEISNMEGWGATWARKMEGGKLVVNKGKTWENGQML